MLDRTDIRLLSALQKNAHLTAQELSEILNLSPSQAGRRRQRLETEGYIQGYFARLDPIRVGLHVQAFVQVQLINDVLAHLLGGYCTDLNALNRLIHEILLPHAAVSRVQSQIVMDQLKRDAPLPT